MTPLALQPVEPLPQQVPRLRVEPGRRLVEQQQLGLVDERPRDREPPLHAARQRIDAVVAPVAELHELEQLLGPPPDLGVAAGRSSARRSCRLSQHGELGVEVVLLRHDTEPGADARAVGRGVQAEHAQLAARSAATRSRSCASSTSCPRRSGRGSRTPRPARSRKSMPSTATKLPKRFDTLVPRMRGSEPATDTSADATGSRARASGDCRRQSAGFVPASGASSRHFQKQSTPTKPRSRNHASCTSGGADQFERLTAPTLTDRLLRRRAGRVAPADGRSC